LDEVLVDQFRYSLAEYTKLEFIKEIGWTHMRILEGVGTLTQLSGLMARLCKLVRLQSFVTSVIL
jgi:replication factor C subunit 2/4